MKLRTKIAVSFNDGITGQSNAIVEGVLNSANQMLRFEFESNFRFEYLKEDGFLITENSLTLSKQEIDGLYELVKTEIPTDLSYSDVTLYVYYLGMRVKMAATFGIAVDDIEIINAD